MIDLSTQSPDITPIQTFALKAEKVLGSCNNNNNNNDFIQKCEILLLDVSENPALAWLFSSPEKTELLKEIPVLSCPAPGAWNSRMMIPLIPIQMATSSPIQKSSWEQNYIARVNPGLGSGSLVSYFSAGSCVEHFWKNGTTLPGFMFTWDEAAFFYEKGGFQLLMELIPEKLWWAILKKLWDVSFHHPNEDMRFWIDEKIDYPNKNTACLASDGLGICGFKDPMSIGGFAVFWALRWNIILSTIDFNQKMVRDIL